jgi:hypothetical protein
VHQHALRRDAQRVRNKRCLADTGWACSFTWVSGGYQHPHHSMAGMADMVSMIRNTTDSTEAPLSSLRRMPSHRRFG